jgi:hypothetical protein
MLIVGVHLWLRRARPRTVLVNGARPHPAERPLIHSNSGYRQHPRSSRMPRRGDWPLDTDCGCAVHMQSPVLSRAEAVQRLSAYEDEIRALCVTRLALFGSVLRGQTDAVSDVDVLVHPRSPSPDIVTSRRLPSPVFIAVFRIPEDSAAAICTGSCSGSHHPSRTGSRPRVLPDNSPGSSKRVPGSSEGRTARYCRIRKC